MKKTLRSAFIATIPVLTGYIVLGFGFGLVLKSVGFGILVAFAMSFLIYAGSMQYVAVGLLTGGASIITTALTTLMVNARHIFYGISMLDKYKGRDKCTPYLIFALTDETYSLVCNDNPEIKEEDRTGYYFWVTILNHSYWVIGSVLGAVAGTIITFNTKGVDFALTALFITVFVDQWLNSKRHTPAIIGLLASIGCLTIFGKDGFLIPTMLIIALVLSLIKEGKENG